MSKTITLADIARKSRVSISTVSLVLRDKPGIPLETKELVLQAARTLGYHQRIKFPIKAERDSSGHTKLKNCGLLVKTEPDIPPPANPFYSQVLGGIEEVCRRKKINLLYATLPVDEQNLPMEIPHLLADSRVDGLLLVGVYIEESFIHACREKSIPLILVDSYSDSGSFDSVLSDNRYGAYQAVNFLLDRGHRHIGMVASPPDAFPSLRDRREGYLDAIREHGISDTYFADCRINQTVEETIRLLNNNPQITALFCVNDDVCIRALHAIQTLGKRVPEDVSLMGFDDIDIIQHISPPLTSMHVDKTGMGRMAIQLLLNRIEFPDSGQIASILRPSLSNRSSIKTLVISEHPKDK